MKTTTRLNLIVATATLLAAASAQAFFDPHIGRWASRDPIGEKGGLSLYVVVRNDLINGLDVLGLKPAVACELDGSVVSLLFDGRKLSGAGLGLQAVSGVPTTRDIGDWSSWTPSGSGHGGDILEKTFDYSTHAQTLPNQGPIPSGSYWFDSCEERSFWTSPVQHGPFGWPSWGDYSWSLHPDEGNNMYGRSGFFIHGGGSWGSAGCIDLTSGDAALHALEKG